MILIFFFFFFDLITMIFPWKGETSEEDQNSEELTEGT